MRVATVTIGRNVGRSPMRPTDWDAYRASVRTALGAHASELWVDADYAGAWDDVPEDAHAYVAPIDDDVDTLRSELRSIARRFSQDAIGLTLGESELVR